MFTSQMVPNMMRSLLSVIRPPYWISDTMYLTVIHDTCAPFLTSSPMVAMWFCRNCTLACQSPWLNSYGMQNPIGPNFLRSTTLLWMKHCAKSIGFHSVRR
eukprot:gene19132-biopygen19398